MRIAHRILALSLLTLAGRLPAMDITVTRFDDPTPAACTPTDCSLREAVLLANALVGADTIHLAAGAYQLTIPGAGEDLGATGDLDVRDDLTILGAGRNQTSIVMSGQLDRVIDLYYDVNLGTVHQLSLSDLSVSGGSVHKSAMFDPNELGGCVKALGELALTNVTLGNCAADVGGGLYLSFATTASLQHVGITGNQATVSAGGAEIVSIASTATSTLHDLVISQNSVPGNDTNDSAGGLYLYLPAAGSQVDQIVLSGNQAPTCGGGVINVTGNAAFYGFTVTGNTAYGDGGGLCIGQQIHDVSADLYDFDVENNDAYGDGGGIAVIVNPNYEVSYALRLHGARIVGNTAHQGNGGGLAFPRCQNCNATTSRSLTLVDSTLSDNIATATSTSDGVGVGGGAFSRYSLNIVHTTFSANQAATYGGAVYVANPDSVVTQSGSHSILSSTFDQNRITLTGTSTCGGAVYAILTGLTIDNSTFDDNAAAHGGALCNDASYVYIFRSTLAAGSSTPLGAVGTAIETYDFPMSPPATNIVNSVLDGNCDGVTPSASIANLAVGGNSCGSSYVLTETLLQLGALADNGGPTRTRLPGPGSYLIGTGNPTYCSTFDQRGDVRPNPGTCDIGAVQTTGIDDVIFRDGFQSF